MSKEKRDRLFKSGRPLIRELNLREGNDYGKDIGILWVAYKKNPFDWLPKSLDQKQFAIAVEEISKTQDLFVAEDTNAGFSSGKGIVGLIAISNDGWKYEPHIQFMPWVTKRSLLKVTISLLQFLRYSRKVGVCVVFSLGNSVSLFNKCIEYGVLHRVGKIVNGDPRGDEFVYSISGKRKK